MTQRQAIAVIGMAGRLPGVTGLDGFWELMKRGTDSVRAFPERRREELEALFGSLDLNFAQGAYLDELFDFDAQLLGISREEGRYLAPQTRMLLELTEAAIADAGYAPAQLAGGRTGVYVAESRNLYTTLLGARSPYALANSGDASLAGRIAHSFDLRGPALMVGSACSSSLLALQQACEAIQAGHCDQALVGAAEVILLPMLAEDVAGVPIYSNAQKLRAFDAGADGTVSGEGGGVLLLKSLARAQADGDTLHGVIRATAANHNGSAAAGYTAPHATAQAENLTALLQTAGIDANGVDVVEAHGTGTALGDPIEISALDEVFARRRQPLWLSTAKANVGHLNPAAGMVGVLKLLLMLRHGQVPPAANFAEPHPLLAASQHLQVPRTTEAWTREGRPRRGLVTSLGLFGTNGHCLIEEAPEAVQRQTGTCPLPILLSARNLAGLAQYAAALAAHLRVTPYSSWDLVLTLSGGRRRLPKRALLLPGEPASLLAQLDALAQGDETAQLGEVASAERDGLSLWFLDPAEGQQSGDTGLTQLVSEAFPAEGEAIVTGAHYYYHVGLLLRRLGLSPRAMMGIGRGKLVSEALLGKWPASELPARATQLTASPSPDDARILAAAKAMKAQGVKSAVLFGAAGETLTRLQRLLPQAGLPIITAIEPNATCLSRSLAHLDAALGTLDWSGLLAGRAHRRSLPLAPLVRERLVLPKPKRAASLLDVWFEREPAGEPASAPANETAYNEAWLLALLAELVPDLGEISAELELETLAIDSLEVLEITARLEENFHIELPAQAIYDAITVAELHAAILAKTVTGTDKSLANNDLPKQVEEQWPAFTWTGPARKRPTPARVLVTGANGFLGLHLLHALLEQTEAEVIAMVRPAQHQTAETRLREAANWFYPGDSLMGSTRLQVVSGDVTSPGLGPEVSRLVGIDAVFHLAARVDHYGPYAQFEALNVTGTRHVLDYCRERGGIELHHVSTLAVAGSSTRPVRFSENLLYHGQHLAGPYSRSKLAAEALLVEAAAQGQPVSIYRVGNLVGRHGDGHFQRNIAQAAVYAFFKGFVALGACPDDPADTGSDLTAVDLCAEAMTRLFAEGVGEVYHLGNPHVVTNRELCGLFERLGFPVEAVSPEAFRERLRKNLANGSDDEARRVMAMHFLEATNEGLLPPHFCYQHTTAKLAELGFRWPEPDADWLQRLLAHAGEVGFMNVDAHIGVNR